MRIYILIFRLVIVIETERKPYGCIFHKILSVITSITMIRCSIAFHYLIHDSIVDNIYKDLMQIVKKV